jgi:hypothetical protein
LIVSTIENVAAKEAALGIIQQPTGGEIVYATKQEVNAADIAARLYKDLVCNYTLLSRIQQIKITIDLSL